MALTATATQEVRRDICKSLNLKDPAVICTGFDRYFVYKDYHCVGFLHKINKKKHISVLN